MYSLNNPVLFCDSTGNSATVAVAVGVGLGTGGTVVVAVAVVAVVVVSVAVTTSICNSGESSKNADVNFYKEHTNNKRKSILNKHQQGQARKAKDAGGEKGDIRRTPRKDKRK